MKLDLCSPTTANGSHHSSLKLSALGRFFYPNHGFYRRRFLCHLERRCCEGQRPLSRAQVPSVRSAVFQPVRRCRGSDLERKPSPCTKVSKVHPVHKLFLYFYRAVCCESLGQISHNYSSNKIPLLEQSRDAFILANEALAPALLATAVVESKIPNSSPWCVTLDILAHFDDSTSPPAYRSPLPHVDRTKAKPNASLTATPEYQLSKGFTTPNFDDYSPRCVFDAVTPTHEISTKVFPRPDQRRQVNHKARLSRSLSSQHTLAHDLVPSPLFSRAPSSEKESLSQSPSITFNTPVNTHPMLALSKPLPPTPNNRPLPDLPFGHNPQFVRKGKRFIVVPRRKSALSTLIRQFEWKELFEDTSCFKGGDPTTPLADGATPSTERFKQIAAIFAKKNEELVPVRFNLQNAVEQQGVAESEIDNLDGKHDKSGSGDIFEHNQDSDPESDKENLDPQTLSCLNETPTNRPRRSRDSLAQISSKVQPTTPNEPQLVSAQMLPPPVTNIQAYSDHLSSLQHRLTLHANTVSNTITKTLAIQQTHEEEKRKRFVNMYTHCRSSSPPSPSQSPTNSKSSHRASRISPSKDFRLRSFWSLQDAAAATGKRRRNTNHKSKNNGEEEDAETTRRKTERIDRLRAQGWPVRKESVGFKGVDWYARYASVVDEEIRRGRSLVTDTGAGELMG